MTVKSMSLIIVSVLLGAVGQVMMKLGSIRSAGLDAVGLKGIFLKYFFNLPTLTGLFLYGISAVVWILAISKVELSYAYPMVALGYVVVFLLSYFLFGETMSLLRIGGLAFIIVGVLLIAKS